MGQKQGDLGENNVRIVKTFLVRYTTTDGGAHLSGKVTTLLTDVNVCTT